MTEGTHILLRRMFHNKTRFLVSRANSGTRHALLSYLSDLAKGGEPIELITVRPVSPIRAFGEVVLLPTNQMDTLVAAATMGATRDQLTRMAWQKCTHTNSFELAKQTDLILI